MVGTIELTGVPFTGCRTWPTSVCHRKHVANTLLSSAGLPVPAYMLAQANKKKKPVFIASTSEVYGKSQATPFREDGDLLLGPTVTGRWSYACSKAIDEYLALAYWKERKLPTVIGRLFNTVGPRQTGRYGMVVPTFVRQALASQPIG